jgi:outer membrane receptor protein involved in Fe transport
MRKIRQLFFCGLLALMASLCVNTMAQHIRGALEGTVADPNGAALSGARVVVKSNATSAEVTTTANDRGYFNVQNLEAGTYTVTVEQAGFRKYVAKDVNVKVGAVTPLAVALQVGAQEQTVEVTATSTEAVVDTSRSTVDGVVTAKTIENLPLNGRNFLDLAQLEPGVQVRDGGDFDPTKNQMVGVSVGGRRGRSTRIQVDGVDITDESVGTTTTNISNESIQEFQVSRSSLDPSTDLTSSGAISIVTRAGGNEFHGSGFSFFRNEPYAADLRTEKTTPTTEKPSFERQNFGGGLGGYIVKDRLFWHIEGERTRQNGQQFTAVAPFPQFNGNFAVPLRETNVGGRLDFNITQNLRSFYRFNHNDNTGVTGFGLNNLAAFANANFTNWHVVGADYNTARWTHSLRYSYLNFNNSVVDANSLAGTPETLDPAGAPILVNIQGQLSVGPNASAPQTTFQDNQQIKYDASATTGNHTFRFGSSYNRIVASGFASFFDTPRIRAPFNAASIAAAIRNGGADNPLNFPLSQVVLGNGLGFASEKPAHNLPFGGFYNNRLGLYAQDSWKIKRNITLNLGLRYDFDSNIANSDLARTPLLAQFSQDLAGKVDRPANLFAPQVGFAWDIFSDGKTVIRGGAGLFYESNIINNALFDRALNLPPGLGNSTPVLSVPTGTVLVNPATGDCLFDIRNYNSTPGNCSGGVNLLNQPLRSVIGAVQNIQSVYQQVSAGLAANFPPPGVDPLFNQDLDTQNGLIFNKYKRPYSIMFNIGVQREIRPGLVLSVDYLRNRGVHFGQIINLNRIGAANTLNLGAAQAAIAATANGFDPCIGMAGSSAINCVIANGGSIFDFAGNGLDSGDGINDGPDDVIAAFQGNNPNFRNIGVIAPVGLSVYNALTASLRGRLGAYGPLRGTTLTVSYSLSRFKATGADSEAGFQSLSAFNDAPTKFFGPAALDRTHQLTVSFLTDLPLGFKINSTTRFATALSASALLAPASASGLGEIFFTDLDGDGVTGDPLPGTNRGSFGRDVDVARLNQLIASFNNGVANGLTPAAQALIAAGLFTREQLIQLGATINNGRAIGLAPSNQVGMDSFVNTDVRVSKTFAFKERVRFEPMVEVFNLFNVSNFDSPGNPLSGVLNGAVGSINGTTPLNRNNRYGLGSGSFAPGIPRALQFGLRVGF